MKVFGTKLTLIELLTAAALLGLLAFMIPWPQSQLETEHPDGGGWRIDDVSGRTFVRFHDVGRTHYNFHPDGNLYLTHFDKDDVPCAPLYCWAIDDDGYLSYCGPKMRLVSRKGQDIVVISNNEKFIMEYRGVSQIQ